MRSPLLRFGPFRFDPNSGVLERDGVELPLPPRVLTVLEVLLRRAGEVVPRQELIDSAWKDAFVTDTSLAEAVSVLRQALGDDPQTPSYIQTLHRRGYRFVAPVAEATHARHAQAPQAPQAPQVMTLSTVAVATAEPATAAGLERPRAGAADVSPSIAYQLLPWSVAAMCAILAAIAVWRAVTGSETAAPPVTRFAIAALPGTRFDTRAPALALSPDAARVAWSGCDASGCRLYVRSAESLDPQRIGGTEDAAAPFFSPDGRWIGFFAGGRVKKVALAGGAPVILADAADPLGAVWTRGNDIVYGGAGPGLRVVPATGGESTALTTPLAARGEVRHAWPAQHPAADLLLFTVTTIPGADGAGSLATLMLDARRGDWTPLVPGTMGAFAGPDVLVFSNRANRSELQAVTFDARRTPATSTPQPVAGALALSAGPAQFATSPAGALITLPAAPSDVGAVLFWWTARAAATRAAQTAREDGARPVKSGRPLEQIALSPDGRHAAGIDRADGGRPDIWIADLERGTASRLTHDGINVSPVWSHDGVSVFYASSNGGSFAIHVRDADSVRPPRRLHAAAEHAFPTSVSPDGSRLAFVSRDPATGADIWALPLGGGPVVPLVRTPFDDLAASFSPDGRLIAYQSNDAGRWEVYVQRETGERRVTVSTEGGMHPFWAADGRAVFFRAGDRLMRAAVSTDGASAGTPDVWGVFTGAQPVGTDATGRVLVQRDATQPAGAAVLALHWIREARQLLGPPPAAMPR